MNAPHVKCMVQQNASCYESISYSTSNQKNLITYSAVARSKLLEGRGVAKAQNLMYSGFNYRMIMIIQITNLTFHLKDNSEKNNFRTKFHAFVTI